METKKAMQTLRLLLGAADAEKQKTAIAPEFVPQIEAARGDLLTMRGVDVFEAVLALHRSGINPSLDVRLIARKTSETESERRDRLGRVARL